MTLDTNKTDEQLLVTIQQEYKILAEYKMIESEKIEGVYVIPSFENSLLWFGVMFIRSGYYVNGVFRFNILLPDKFPEDKTLPTIIFQNEIFHPLICPYTGTLNIGNAFPLWREGEDHIWQVLKYTQAIFVDLFECLKITKKVSNQDAADLLSQNRSEFIAKVKQCVTNSAERLYEPAPTDDPHYIVFDKFNSDVHGPILQKIKDNGTILNVSPPTSGLSWVKEGEYKPLTKE